MAQATTRPTKSFMKWALLSVPSVPVVGGGGCGTSASSSRLTPENNYYWYHMLINFIIAVPFCCCLCLTSWLSLWPLSGISSNGGGTSSSALSSLSPLKLDNTHYKHCVVNLLLCRYKDSTHIPHNLISAHTEQDTHTHNSVLMNTAGTIRPLQIHDVCTYTTSIKNIFKKCWGM